MISLFTELSLFSLVAVFLAIFAICFKLYLVVTYGVCLSTKRLDDKTVIITGANTGIGKETALDLAQRGARVILACRNLKKATIAKDDIVRESGNKNVLVKELDLASLKSVRKFASDILKTETKLDILINNAGCAQIGKKLTEDGLELQMQSNHFGHFLLTNLLLGLLVNTEGSRIVVVSALAHVFVKKFDVNNLNFTKENTGTKFFEIYSTTKLCNILFTRELARKLQLAGHTDITVNALHPGIIETEFGNFIGENLKNIVLFITKFFLKSVKQGAQTTIHVAVAEELKDVTGEYFSDCKIVGISNIARDDGIAKKLWESSETLVGLKPEEKFF